MRASLRLANSLIIVGAGAPSAVTVLAPERAGQASQTQLAWFLLTSAGVLLVGLGLSARALVATPAVRTRFHMWLAGSGALFFAMQVAILLLFLRPYLWGG